ncbi:enoyl-CoA hydratase/isomerase family protein [Arthrobacter sp. AQ5-05]|uniref:enoyl-CoA hydratase/isomerase family protein n=1 Tax=Arthrobacter sp. AQ5-05 TaxID=2184581 RepID=UPI0012B6494E|nr:enoyl-CoA hydratase-related protein [Arthrobacter sp. AQ5-05]
MSYFIIDHPRPGLAIATINRPEKLNTMTGPLLEEAVEQFAALDRDPETRVLILTGAGRAFCAGGDLSEGPGGAVTAGLSGEAAGDLLLDFMKTSTILSKGNFTTIAAVNGACAGAGLSWAAACDLRVSASAARFNTAFLNAGLSGDFGGYWFLERLIGRGRAIDLYLRPRPFDAQEALDIGFVSAVVHNALESASEIADKLLDCAPIALQSMKRNFVDSSLPLGEYLTQEAHRHSACVDTNDAAEAARAFVEKRAPHFVGR